MWIRQNGFDSSAIGGVVLMNDNTTMYTMEVIIYPQPDGDNLCLVEEVPVVSISYICRILPYIMWLYPARFHKTLNLNADVPIQSFVVPVALELESKLDGNCLQLHRNP